MTTLPALAATTSEVAETEAFIYSRLTGSTALTAQVGNRVFSYLAPPETAYPFVVFNWQAGRDIETHDGTTVWVEMVYTVKAWAESGAENGLNATAAAVHFALHGATGLSPSGDGLIYSCLRDSNLAMGEVSGGRQYRTAGGMYRIRTQLVGT